MKKIYIIVGGYEPNGAPTNRLLSFISTFEKKGIKAEVVFIAPNHSRDKVVRTYQNITFRYLWDKSLIKKRIYDKLIAGCRVSRFCKQLESGAKVFLFGASAYVHYFTSRNDIKVYHERTEHPDVVRLRFGFERKRYLANCRKLSGLFVISTALKEYFVGIGVPEEKVTIVNMTVDPARFEGIQKDMSIEKYIAYCGTASNNKDGVNKLIEAFGFVAKKHKDVKLYIIGKAPTVSDESGNLQLVENLGLKERVVFTGVVPAEQMPQLLTNASALALARPDSLQAQNGFPTKLGEYLLTANPVVVTKVGDIPLFLRDGESALLAETGNSQEFADKLCWALENPTESATIGMNGREVALSNFNALLETQKIIKYILG